jgi:hypothetical protein
MLNIATSHQEAVILSRNLQAKDSQVEDGAYKNASYQCVRKRKPFSCPIGL